MSKITFIGAGSTVFAQNLLGDILSFPELSDVTISLHDIDPERLRTTEIVAQKVASQLGATPTIEASLNRREALEGADYAVGMYQIGGYKRPRHHRRFRDPEEVRPAADHRRHAGHRGHHARAAHHPRHDRDAA